MKKIILIICSIFLLTSCSFNEKKEIINNQENTKQETPVEENIVTYTDENPIKIGLYSRNIGYYTLLHEYNTKITPNKDINTFQVLPLNEEKVTYKGKYQNYIKGLWDSIETNYKIGLNINYSLQDGTVINHTLYDPSNTQKYTDYIQIYFYDAIKHMNDKWYSHITNEEFNSSSYITSFKLTAGTKANEIVYPVKISIYTYDTEDDFDDNNNYRGNSIYTINLNNE